MAITARVATGVQAVEVTVTDQGRRLHAIVTREALHSRWGAGPTQDDLLRVAQAHSREIEDEVLKRAAATGHDRFVINSW